MSLVLALSVAAWAGTAVWLDGAPDPAALPGYTPLSLEAAAPGEPWTEADQRAIGFLAEELAAVRPMADVFDGELQIMVRLGAALADVRAVRAEDRDLIYAALAFQGFAVHRYFQDKLGTDPAAAPYRVQIDGRVEIAPWVNAVALNPERLPSLSDIGDQAELLAFQELRARHLLTQPATVAVTNLPPSGRLLVDGRESAADRARVLPGEHHLALVVDGRIEARSVRWVAPGESVSLTAPSTPAELRALGQTLAGAPTQARLSSAQLATLERLEPPLALVVPGRRGPLVYDLSGAELRLRVEEKSGDTDRFVARGALGAGWLYDGEFLLQNHADGAPESVGTVNAFTPWLSVGAELRPLPSLAVGAGLDLGLPVGDWHDLPVGDDTVRLRAYPHLALGHPVAQLTAGLMLPWRLGIGPRVHLPLGRVLELQGAYVYGLGLDRPRESGPEFEPSDCQTAWLGLGARL